MVGVYVVSSEPYSGKTLTCLVLGLRWQRRGLRVGYLKPLGLVPVMLDQGITDEDVPFLAEQLGLGAPAVDLCPVLLGPGLYREDPERLRRRVQRAYQAHAAGKEVMLLGGLGPVLTCGTTFGLSAPELAGLLDARAVLVTRPAPHLTLDNVIAAHRALGARLAGVIFNRVTPASVEALEQEVLPCLNQRGIKVLGAVPDDSLLSSVTVREIARVTAGKLLCGEERIDQLVENIVVGAMGVDSALRYFRRAARKCVITGGDRSDLQLAALDASTRCLVLTGSLYPNQRVLNRAAELGVPVLLVAEDTMATAGTIEQLLGKQRLKEPAKVEHALAQFTARLDLEGLDAVLGLTQAAPTGPGTASAQAAV